MKTRVLAVAVLVLIGSAASAQTTEAQRRSEAADVALYIATQTQAVTIESPRAGQSVDPQAQAYVDELGALSAKLESELRAGASKAETREIYRDMRRVRLQLITHAANEGLVLPVNESRLFEQMLAELSRYHRGE